MTAPNGFAIRVTHNGVKAGVLDYYHKGRERRITIGQWPTWTALALVKEARVLRQRIDRREDPLADRQKAEAAGRNTFSKGMDEFFAHPKGGLKLKSAKPRRRMLERLVVPEFGDRDIASIKRSEILRLLDKIAKTNGEITANRRKAYTSKIFSWYGPRIDDDFANPFIRGMGYSTADEVPRQRILDDGEIRSVWGAATGPYGALCKFILLTGARRSEAALMPRHELKDGVWTLPADAGPDRNKVSEALARPLSKQALAVLPPGSGHYVFSANGGARSIEGSIDKEQAKLLKASGTSGWSLHDLRRTARSLMTRAKVLPDDAERCLGHTVGKIRKTYDVSIGLEYMPQKAAAYKALADLLELIIDPPADNVTALREAVRHG